MNTQSNTTNLTTASRKSPYRRRGYRMGDYEERLERMLADQETRRKEQSSLARIATGIPGCYSYQAPHCQ